MTQTSYVEALMLLGSHCPFCPAVLESLGMLVKQGEISKLEVINIEQRPDIAQQLSVRSVPWVRIGAFELQGQQSLGELKAWTARAASNGGIKEYISELINSGNLDKARQLIEETPDYFDRLVELFADEDTSLNIRVGIGALMEIFADNSIMLDRLSLLGDLTGHDNPQVRIDACHYLSLTGKADVRQYIVPLLNDAEAEVRDTAMECLADLDD